MKNINKLIVGLVAVAALSVTIVSAQVAPGSRASAARQQQIDLQTYFPELSAPTENVGAISNLSAVDSPYVNVNGANFYYYNQPITASSSIPCSFRNPFGATSTISYYSMLVTSNGLGAQNLEISTSSTNFGSSTPAFVYQYVAGTGQFNINWQANSTTTNAKVIGMGTNNSGTSDVVLGPNDYVNVKVATSTPTAFTTYYKGYCKALVRQL